MAGAAIEATVGENVTLPGFVKLSIGLFDVHQACKVLLTQKEE